MSSLWSLQLRMQEGLSTPQQHGILDLVRGSGLVVQAILYLLVLFSVVSWGIIAQKHRQIRQALRLPQRLLPGNPALPRLTQPAGLPLGRPEAR